MPKFIDHHATMPMPPEMVQAAAEHFKAGEKDEFGVIGLNAFVGASETWCLTDAPNAEAVHKGTRAWASTWALATSSRSIP